MPAIVSRWNDLVGRRAIARAVRGGVAKLRGTPVVRGVPQLELCSGSTLELGDGVVLDSRQTGYHVKMFGSVRILTDRAGARISIGERTYVHASGLHASDSIVIGSRCLIAGNCQLFDSNGHELAFDAPHERLTRRDVPRPIVIEDDVWLGTGVIVLPGTHIGEGAVVAAGSVVGGRVAPRTLVRGNPAVLVERAMRREAAMEAR